MSERRRAPWIVLALVGALVAVLVVALRPGRSRTPEAAARQGSASQDEPVAAAAPGATPGDAAPAPPRPATPRTRVPRPSAPATRAAPTPAPAAPAGTAPAATPTAAAPAGLRDRRENPPPGGDLLREALRERLDAVEAAVATCLREWAQADAAFAGRVTLAFQLGADGLQDAWVRDVEDVPFGPLTCFGAAVYEQDWAGLSPEPIEITVPFELDSRDAGAP